MAQALSPTQYGFLPLGAVPAAIEWAKSTLKRIAIEREVYLELNAHTDAELEDIGLTRHDIPFIAKKAAQV